jgi:putative endonuclease
MSSTAFHRKALGVFGENVAADHLRSLGMVILDRNWHCRFGEIDIIARDGSTLVVCEVKTRSTRSFGSPQAGVTPQKAARLRRLAAHWLALYGVNPPAVRIDVVSVYVPNNAPAEVERIAGIA